MEFSIKHGNAAKEHSDCIIVGVFDSQLSAAAQALDEASSGLITQIIKSGDFEGKLESTLMFHQVANISSERVLLVGLGKSSDFSEKAYCKAVRASIKALAKSGAKQASSFLVELPLKNLGAQRKVALLVEAALDANYQFDAIKKKKDQKAKKGLSKLAVYVDTTDKKAAEAGLADGKVVAAGVSLAKDLGNLPPNVCNPTYLADEAVAMGKQYGFDVEVLERKALQKLGMGSFLGVAEGSETPPKFIIMQHLKGKKSQKPVVLVGKGITFDTGGISSQTRC